MPMPGGGRAGLVVGTGPAITPNGLAYLTRPYSEISSAIPMLFCRRASRKMPMILKRLLGRPARPPNPLSSTPIWTRRVKVFSLTVAHPPHLSRSIDCGLIIIFDLFWGSPCSCLQILRILFFFIRNGYCHCKLTADTVVLFFCLHFSIKALNGTRTKASRKFIRWVPPCYHRSGF